MASGYLHRTARDRQNAARVASESVPAMDRITQINEGAILEPHREPMEPRLNRRHNVLSARAFA